MTTLNIKVLRYHEHFTLLLYKMIKMNGHSVVFGQLAQKSDQITPNTVLLFKTIKMDGHSVVFGQLAQKLEQITPNNSTLQDDQNEWSQCSIWTAGSKVRPNNTKQFYSLKTISIMNGHSVVFGQLVQKLRYFLGFAKSAQLAIKG